MPAEALKHAGIVFISLLHDPQNWRVDTPSHAFLGVGRQFQGSCQREPITNPTCL